MQPVLKESSFIIEIASCAKDNAMISVRSADFLPLSRRYRMVGIVPRGMRKKEGVRQEYAKIAASREYSDHTRVAKRGTDILFLAAV